MILRISNLLPLQLRETKFQSLNYASIDIDQTYPLPSSHQPPSSSLLLSPPPIKKRYTPFQRKPPLHPPNSPNPSNPPSPSSPSRRENDKRNRHNNLHRRPPRRPRRPAHNLHLHPLAPHHARNPTLPNPPRPPPPPRHNPFLSHVPHRRSLAPPLPNRASEPLLPALLALQPYRYRVRAAGRVLDRNALEYVSGGEQVIPSAV